MPLIQVATVSADSGDLILRAAGVVILALQGWHLRTTHALEKKFDRLEVLLVGYDGKNGMRSQVRKLDGRVTILERRGSGGRRHYDPSDNPESVE